MEHLSRFLGDYSEFASVCDSLDVAGIVAQRDDRLELVCARLTVGSSEGAGDVGIDQPFAPWRVFRYRTPAAEFPELARGLAENGRLQLGGAEVVCSEPAPDLHRNTFVRTPAVFTSGDAQVTWLGGNCGARTFTNYADHEQFSQLIETSDEYQNVSDLVSKLRLRQSLDPDEARGVRLEIEAPMYFRGAVWDVGRVTVHLSAPRSLDLTQARVKWQISNERGTSPIVRTAAGCEAVVETEDDHVDATVIFRSFKLWSLSEDRPQRLADYFPDSDDELAREAKEKLPDYSRFETTRQTVRRSINKQVARDPFLFKIIARDVDDAIDCLERGKYKLAAILAGGIIEATLLGRLAGDSSSDLDAAFRAAFPSHGATKSVPPLDELKLYQLIAVAEKRGKLKDHKLYDGIRDWRNFVHPNLEASRGSIDITAAQIAVTAAVRLLLNKS